MGIQLQVRNFLTLYPVLYFNFRAVKQSVMGDAKNLILHHQLNEAANAHDYTIYATILNEEEFAIKQIGNKLVVV